MAVSRRTAFVSAPTHPLVGTFCFSSSSACKWRPTFEPRPFTQPASIRLDMSAVNDTPPKQVQRTGEPYGVTMILLAGGVGKRMGSSIPKQLLKLGGLTILERSLIALSNFTQVTEIIVVLDRSLRETTSGGLACKNHPLVKFADPGKERVDSVESAISVARSDATLYCIHDAARPLVKNADILKVINDAWKYGAAVLAVPCKATIKYSSDSQEIDETLDRSKLWEMQTPQVIDATTLKAGFLKASNSIAPPVTDDVSLVELLGLPVRITQGSYDNIKITTPEDILFANAVLQAAELSHDAVSSPANEPATKSIKSK